MINVPEQFMPTINTVYPYENYEIFEDWVSHQKIITHTDRHYLPIQWTAYQVNNNYGNDKNALLALQQFVDSLPRDLKYWTICQYDDGILVDLKDLDVLTFSMSKKVGIEMPLLCMPHSFKWNGKKSIIASFIGTHTHPVREHIFKIVNGNYYISDNQHNTHEFCDIVSQSLFGLCPRGYGLNSFRITECMQYETIPVYISDDFIKPFDANFDEFAILIEEKDAHRITEILSQVSELEIVMKQIKIREIYKKYYTYEGAFQNIIRLLNENSSNP